MCIGDSRSQFLAIYCLAESVHSLWRVAGLLGTTMFGEQELRHTVETENTNKPAFFSKEFTSVLSDRFQGKIRQQWRH